MSPLRLVTTLLISAGVMVVGCSRQEPVVVRVFADRYEVAGARFELATPVIDEVVSRKPREVHVYLCAKSERSVRKLYQFETELNARHKAEIKGGFLPEADCK